MIRFGPEVDGDVLAARPIDAVRSGQGAAIGILVAGHALELPFTFDNPTPRGSRR
jgi:hypothetical protein